MSLNIGSQLKKMRVLLGKSQNEFCEGTISESFYSRVENGKSNINIIDLLKLLNKNKVSLYDFFEPTVKESNQKNVILAFMNQDIEKLKKYSKFSDFNDSKSRLKFKLMFAILENRVRALSIQTKQKAEKQLLIIGKYDTNFLFNFRLLVPIIDYHVLKELIEYTVFARQSTNLDDLSLKVLYQTILAVIKRSYEEKKSEDVKMAIDFLNKLPKRSTLILEELLLQYDKCVLTDDNKGIQSIMSILKISGYEKYIELLCL